MREVFFRPVNASRLFSTFTSKTVEKADELFHYYKGPGGLRRKDDSGKLEIFNIKSKEWIKTDNPVHHRAVDFDSVSISFAEAAKEISKHH